MTTTDDPSRHARSDLSRRFLFEEADIRGQNVQLDASFREILSIHQYAQGVSRLLGEFLAAAVLLSTNLKFEGKLVLQVRSEGQVPLLMAECDHLLQVRGIARGVEQATAVSDEQLLRDGVLTITVDPARGQRYQGIVPMQHGSLARSLDNYFEQSEQLKSRIWLAADSERAGGLLLQQLPAQVIGDDTRRERQWEHVCALTATVTDGELLCADGEDLLRKLYREDPLRLFDPGAVRFHCSCSALRCRNALAALAPEDIAELLAERGVITMECEFCNQSYRFDRDDLRDIPRDDAGKTLH